jgi:predicted dehydrogenase
MTASLSLLHSSTIRPINWGIIGTGAIAHRFAADLIHVSDANLIAVASRSGENARAFANRFGIPHPHGSYKELAGDPQVDAVYIATPASAHKANIELCLHAGKAVLCEKPLTINARQAEEVVALARQKQVFLMEAMWTRFVPLMVKLRELLAQGVLGEVRHLMADLGSEVAFDPQGRVYNEQLGGGAVLQKGVYLLSLASMVLGSPSTVKSFSIAAETGVDEATGVLLGYRGSMATLWCSVGVRSGRRGAIVGTKGEIVIHPPIICPSTLSLRLSTDREKHQAPVEAHREPSLKARLLHYGKQSPLIRNLRERFPAVSDRLLYGIHSSTICLPPVGEGLHYQVSEVHRCLRAGKLESDVMPLHESVSIMTTLDRIREQSDTIRIDPV